MIPNYQECMKPLLEALTANPNEAIKLQNAVDILANHFQLSEEERNQLLPSGKYVLFNNRVSWAKVYLMKAGLLESPQRGYFKISQRGLNAVSVPDVAINNTYLKQFEEFNNFTNASTTNTKPSKTEETNFTDNQNDETAATPDETLQQSYKTINDALADELLSKTRNVSPAFFEQLLIDLLVAMGYSGNGSAHKLGKSHDGGVDGVIKQDPLGVDQIHIQAKRYAQGNNISSEQIQSFSGALDGIKSKKGIFITTSDFTKFAVDAAEKSSAKIVLINGIELAKLMLRYNIGCRHEQTLHIKKIDEEFFDQN